MRSNEFCSFSKFSNNCPEWRGDMNRHSFISRIMFRLFGDAS